MARSNTPSNNIKAVMQEEGVAAKSDFLQVGMPVETTVPSVGTDGQIKRPWHASYGEYVIAGYDVSLGALTINDPSPAIQAKWGPVAHAQLTAPGSTVSTGCRPYLSYTYQLVVATIDTNVVVRADASADGTSFYPCAAAVNTVANWALAGAQGTATANGTYALQPLVPLNAKEIRFVFVSEAGGAAATIDVTLFLGMW